MRWPPVAPNWSLRSDDRNGRDPWQGSPTPLRMTPGDHLAWGGQFGEKVCPVFDYEVGPAFGTIVGCRVDVGAVRWCAQRDDTA